MGDYGGASGRVKDRCYYDSGGNKVTDKNAIMTAEYYINFGMYVFFFYKKNAADPTYLLILNSSLKLKE